MNATLRPAIRHNKEKNGVEIFFAGIPEVSVRKHLKENNFRWHKFHKCWYAKISSRTLTAAATYGELPEALNNANECRSTAAMVEAQEEAMYERHIGEQGNYALDGF